MKKYVRQEKSQRKHPVASSATSLIRPLVVPADIKERPEWKGPGFTKKTTKPKKAIRASTRSIEEVQEQHLPVALQQLLLNVFQTSLPICQDYDALKVTLQLVRVAMSKLDYQQAFSRLDWIEAYSVRWGPNRALLCATILAEICQEFSEEACIKKFFNPEEVEKTGMCIPELSESTGSLPDVVCFGGGATELMAFAALLRHLRPQSTILKPAQAPKSSAQTVNLQLIDLADWRSVTSTLLSKLITPPLLSKFASQAAKDNNQPFIPSDTINSILLQDNILNATQAELAGMLGSQPSLITLIFTLNDLHSLSTAKSAAFLLKLTLATPQDSLLLVVDSAEPFGTGEKLRGYGMKKLLDFVLLGKRAPDDVDTNPAWKELVREESRLFKLHETLRFPVSLDNIRFQVHLFKRR